MSTGSRYNEICGDQSDVHCSVLADFKLKENVSAATVNICGQANLGASRIILATLLSTGEDSQGIGARRIRNVANDLTRGTVTTRDKERELASIGVTETAEILYELTSRFGQLPTELTQHIIEALNSIAITRTFYSPNDLYLDLNDRLEKVAPTEWLQVLSHLINESAVPTSGIAKKTHAIIEKRNSRIVFAPATNDANYIIAQGIENKRLKEEEREDHIVATMAAFKDILDRDFKVTPNQEVLRSTILDCIALIEKGSLTRHQLEMQIIEMILKTINLGITDLTPENYKKLRSKTIDLITKVGITHPDDDFASIYESYRISLQSINLPSSWGIARAAKLGEGYARTHNELVQAKGTTAEERAMQREFEARYNRLFDEPLLEQRSFRELFDLEKEILDSIGDTADAIAKKILPAELLDEPILQTNDLAHLKQLICDVKIDNEEAYKQMQLAMARLILLHSANLVKTGYNLQTVTAATDAIVRKFGLLPEIFVQNYDAEAPHNYDFTPIPGAKFYIAAPKGEDSAGRKIVIKPPEKHILDVVHDGCRGTLTIPDEEWEGKGDEHILALATRALSYFLPIHGTDIVASRVKIAVSNGDKTKPSSSGKRRSIQITLISKYGSMSTSGKKLGQATFELQIVPTTDFKPPRESLKYEAVKREREEFEGNQKVLAQGKLGFRTSFYKFFIANATAATALNNYNGSRNEKDIEKLMAIAAKYNSKYKDFKIQDPALLYYATVLDILTGPERETIAARLAEDVSSDRATKFLIENLWTILRSMQKVTEVELQASSNGDSLAAKLSVAIGILEDCLTFNDVTDNDGACLDFMPTIPVRS